MLLDEVRGVLVESFAEFEGRHKEHLERVEKGVNWFKGNLVRENESVSGFCGDVVRLEEGEGLCAFVNVWGFVEPISSLKLLGMCQ